MLLQSSNQRTMLKDLRQPAARCWEVTGNAWLHTHPRDSMTQRTSSQNTPEGGSYQVPVSSSLLDADCTLRRWKKWFSTSIRTLWRLMWGGNIVLIKDTPYSGRRKTGCLPNTGQNHSSKSTSRRKLDQDASPQHGHTEERREGIASAQHLNNDKKAWCRTWCAGCLQLHHQPPVARCAWSCPFLPWPPSTWKILC